MHKKLNNLVINVESRSISRALSPPMTSCSSTTSTMALARCEAGVWETA